MAFGDNIIFLSICMYIICLSCHRHVWLFGVWVWDQEARDILLGADDKTIMCERMQLVSMGNETKNAVLPHYYFLNNVCVQN